MLGTVHLYSKRISNITINWKKKNEKETVPAY